MEYLAVALLVVLGLYTLYLNILATLVVRYERGLSRFQRIAQGLCVWLFPLIGASLILHLLFSVSPNTMPKAWIPWPFKKVIYGPPIKPNPHRDDTQRFRGGGWRR